MIGDDVRQYSRLQQMMVVTFTLLAVSLVIAVRIRLLSVPFERDEGEFAYAGQLLLQGILPFKSVYNMKMPGIYAAYALIMAIFGETPAGVHSGLLIVNLMAMILIFQLGRSLSGIHSGMIAAACYGLLSLQIGVQGISAHATHFVTLFAMAGILVVLKGIRDLRAALVFAGGLLLGAGFMMKQHGAAFILFAGFILIRLLARHEHEGGRKRLQMLGGFAAGAMIPFLATCCVLAAGGVFDTFWFWTVDYAANYVTMVPLQSGLSRFWHNLAALFRGSETIWVLAAVGALFSVARFRLPGRINFLGWFAVFSVLAICPGFHFRPHYFVMVLPAVSLLVGAGVAGMCGDDAARLPKEPESCEIDDQKKRAGVGAPLLKRSIWGHLAIAMLFAGLLVSVTANRDYYFKDAPDVVSLKTYPAQFFPESLKIGSYIQRHSAKTDRIAVLGSEPQIYVYANRHSATGYIYMYPLMEDQPFALSMQRQMAHEIESARPEFIVFFSSQPSWVVRPASKRWIFEWIEEYRVNYRTVGIADFMASGNAAYVWGAASADYQPVSPFWCMILKRIDDN